MARRAALVLAAASMTLIASSAAAHADSSFPYPDLALPSGPNAGPSYVLLVCAAPSLSNYATFDVAGLNQFGQPEWIITDPADSFPLNQPWSYDGINWMCGWTSTDAWWWWQPSSLSRLSGPPSVQITYYDGTSNTGTSLVSAFGGTSGWYADNGNGGALGYYACFIRNPSQPSC